MRHGRVKSAWSLARTSSPCPLLSSFATLGSPRQPLHITLEKRTSLQGALAFVSSHRKSCWNCRRGNWLITSGKTMLVLGRLTILGTRIRVSQIANKSWISMSERGHRAIWWLFTCFDQVQRGLSTRNVSSQDKTLATGWISVLGASHTIAVRLILPRLRLAIPDVQARHRETKIRFSVVHQAPFVTSSPRPLPFPPLVQSLALV